MNSQGSSSLVLVMIVAAGSTLFADDRTTGPQLKEPYTLADFENAVLEGHPALAEARASIDAARGRAIQAGLYPNPAINGGTNQLGGEQTQFVATIDQEIITKGKLRLDRATFEREVQEAHAELRQTQFDVLFDVRRSFYRTLIAEERVVTLTNLVTLLQDLYEISLKREKGGESARSDTLLLDVELKRAKVRLRNAKTLLEANRNELATIAGLPVTGAPIAGDYKLNLPAYDIELLRVQLLADNSKIQKFQIEIARRQTALARARVEPFPNILVQTGYQYSVADPNNQAIVQLRVPIPVWNRNQGAILSAQAEVGRSIEALRRTEIDLTQVLTETLGRYAAASELVGEFEREILPVTKETASLTSQGYTGGQVDFLRLLEAQRGLVESNLEYLDAQLSRWLAAIEIARLLQFDAFP